MEGSCHCILPEFFVTTICFWPVVPLCKSISLGQSITWVVPFKLTLLHCTAGAYIYFWIVSLSVFFLCCVFVYCLKNIHSNLAAATSLFAFPHWTKFRLLMWPCCYWYYYTTIYCDSTIVLHCYSNLVATVAIYLCDELERLLHETMAWGPFAAIICCQALFIFDWH